MAMKVELAAASVNTTRADNYAHALTKKGAAEMATPPGLREWEETSRGRAAGRAAGAGAAGIGIGIDLAAVVKHRQAALHIVEFAGIDHVFRLCLEDLLDFDLRILDAGVGGRVAGEDFSQGTRFLLFQ